MTGELARWLEAHQTLLWWTSALSVILFVGTLVFIPLFVARIPVDYFNRTRHASTAERRHTPLHWLGLILRNTLGVILLLMGLLMLVLPGQGLITMLIGLTLISFPGKYALQQRVARQPSVFRTLNWLRRRAGKPDLYRPPPAHPRS